MTRPPERRVAAVLFDLDDTLLDRRTTLDGYLAGYCARVAIPPHVVAMFRARFHELDRSGYAPRAEVFGQLCVEFPAVSSAEAGVRDFIEHAWRVCEWVDGAVEALEWARGAGLATAVVTNGNSNIQRGKLRVLDLANRVDQILVSGEEGVAKPDVEIYRRAAERLGVRADQCVFVGDNPDTDIAGARAAGMRPVWLRRDLPWPASTPPSASISSLRALRALIDATV